MTAATERTARRILALAEGAKSCAEASSETHGDPHPSTCMADAHAWEYFDLAEKLAYIASQSPSAGTLNIAYHADRIGTLARQSRKIAAASYDEPHPSTCLPDLWRDEYHDLAAELAGMVLEGK